MIWFVVLAAAAGLGAFMLRGRWRNRREVVAIGAALALGLLGFAATGRPDIPASPARLSADARNPDGYAAARPLLLSATGDTGAWLTYADALSRSGNPLAAIRGLERGIADDPRDADLWIGLGEALARHEGRVGPAAQFAFDRAAKLAPRSPAPRYFLGLALLRDGRPRAALAVWSTIKRARDPWAPLLAANVAAARRMGGNE